MPFLQLNAGQILGGKSDSAILERPLLRNTLEFTKDSESAIALHALSSPMWMVAGLFKAALAGTWQRYQSVFVRHP